MVIRDQTLIDELGCKVHFQLRFVDLPSVCKNDVKRFGSLILLNQKTLCIWDNKNNDSKLMTQHC